MNETETKRLVRTSRKHWRAEQRQQLLEQYRQSGLSRPAFCRQHGIGYSTLCAWLSKAAKRSVGRPGATAVEVSPLAWIREPVAAEVCLANGTRVRLMSGCAEGLADRLLEWVASCGR